MTNPEVYPITAAFEEQFKAFMPTLALHRVFKAMAANIGEYEHGAVDVEDVVGNWSDDKKDLVRIYAEVCDDVLRTLAALARDFADTETYELTEERLQELREGNIPLLVDDVQELYMRFYEGKFYVGEDTVITLKDFGEWLSGTGSFAGNDPARITW